LNTLKFKFRKRRGFMRNSTKQLKVIVTADDNSIEHINSILRNIIFQLKQLNNVNIEILHDTEVEKLKEMESEIKEKDKEIEHLNKLINIQKDEIKRLKEEVDLQKEKIIYLNMEKEIRVEEAKRLINEKEFTIQKQDKEIKQLNILINIQNILINIQKDEIKHLKDKINLQKNKIDSLTTEKELKEDEIRKLKIINEELIFETMQILYKISEFKDYETYEHTVRVGWLSKKLAQQLGLNNDFAELLGLAAPFHDIGKVGIPDSILLKQGKLDDEEFEIMKKHTIYGYSLLKGYSTDVFKLAAEIALTHHERWNGSGYPRGLKENDIPISAQIVGVADSFDAMVSDRPYKKAKSFNDAFKEIEKNSGILYSPKIVNAFLELKDVIIKKYNEK